MYWYNVNENHLSYPSFSCPLINEHSAVFRNTQHSTQLRSFDNSRHSDMSIRHESEQSGRKIIKNIFTKLRSPSSEELEALLAMSSESDKVALRNRNFHPYWGQLLLQKELYNMNVTTSNAKYRNIACLCKPASEVNKVKAEEIRELATKNIGCLCKPECLADTPAMKDWKKLNNETKERKSSSEESDSRSAEEIKVCLPLNPEEFGGNSLGKGIKLIIYGDKARNNNCKCSTDVADKKSSSYECLACTISKNPQTNNLLADKKKGFPPRFSTKLSSTFPFFKKKHKNIQSTQCSDKCEQTCLVQKLNTTVNATHHIESADKACSCNCCAKTISKTREKEHLGLSAQSPNRCKCLKCGKFDVEKFTTACPGCYCGHDDTLKMILKMEAKQNYRQIKHILKEIKEQRQEIRDLHKRYTSLIKMQICKEGGANNSDKFIECLNNACRNKLDGFTAAGRPKENIDKELKDAINQSTLAQQNAAEKTDANTDTNEKRISESSKLSLFSDDLQGRGASDNKSEELKSIPDITELTENEKDSCICIFSQKKLKSFWGKFSRKKKPVCSKQCECRATKPVEKCRNIPEITKKVRGKKNNNKR